MNNKAYGAGYDDLSLAVAAVPGSEVDIYSPSEEAGAPSVIDVEYKEKEKLITPIRVLIAVLSLILIAAIVFTQRDKLPLPQNERVSFMTSIMDARVAKLHEWVNESEYKPPASTKLWATAFVDDYNVPHVDGLGRLFYKVIDAEDHMCYTMKNSNLDMSYFDNDELTALCDTLRAQGKQESGSISYKDDTGKRFAVYTYIPEYKWFILLDGPKE